MKYYSEETMKQIRTALEQEVLNWPKVTTKKMFGCPCYKADNKLFAFIVTNGVVLTKLSETAREDLTAKFEISSFQAGTRTVKNWPRIPIEDEKDIENILGFVKKSYENAMEQT